MDFVRFCCEEKLYHHIIREAQKLEKGVSFWDEGNTNVLALMLLLCSRSHYAQCSRQENDSVNRFQILFCFRFVHNTAHQSCLKLHFHFEFDAFEEQSCDDQKPYFQNVKISLFQVKSIKGIIIQSVNFGQKLANMRFGIDMENLHRSDGNHMMCPTYYFPWLFRRQHHCKVQTTQ